MVADSIYRALVHTPVSSSTAGWQVRAAASEGQAVTTQRPATAVFITPESLTSFPMASLTVGILSELTRLVFPGIGRYTAVLGFSVFIGLLIFLSSIDRAATRPQGSVQWSVACLVALINSLFLAAAVLGVTDRFTLASK